MKTVKIMIVVIAVLLGAVIAQAAYFRSQYVGYIYRPMGCEYDNRLTKGTTWQWNGKKEFWTIDELKELASYCRVSITGLYGDGPAGLAFTLSDDKVLVVPGLTIDDQIAETYYLTPF